MSIKRLLRPSRVRRIPSQFSWVDQRLVRDRHIGLCGADALALYLFLITVADAQGLSYYSDGSIVDRLSFDGHRLSKAREELQKADLIAYEKPIYQVLALDQPVTPPVKPKPSKPRRSTRPIAVGEMLRRALEGRDDQL
ncbi:MAG: hypothetical protein ACE5I1_17440 [bacterium]